jgi:ribonuclease T1
VAGDGTSTTWSKRLRAWWPFLLVLAAFLGFLVVQAVENGDGGDGGGGDAVSTTLLAPAVTAGGNQVGAAGPVFACTGDEGAGQPTVEEADLPRQAEQTIELIAAGGPFPYDQDGAVFQNREGVLPKQSTGYYHEYTVVTPGSDDRGARRIVAGSCGDLYYTDDHYDSFRLVEASG